MIEAAGPVRVCTIDGDGEEREMPVVGYRLTVPEARERGDAAGGWAAPDANPLADLGAALARAGEAMVHTLDLGAFAAMMRSVATAVGRDENMRRFEAAGGRRPLVGGERAAHWRARLTP